ncbi:site-specific integrase [Paracoccus onubensis]|uniref:tyrosine-type recombinase/integrase n=1 Tax=Paracoccus onubensis TaxID=1675788 RepID=UPI0027310239|nr:site-specific integrase [Paracoccus onubensis]MDP0929039.1 site-specific integrase [Paracoccus onubensis]
MPYRSKNSRFWHYDFQIRGRRFHGSCGTDDYEEAKAVEAAERVKARGSSDITKKFTISQAIGTYWADVCQHQSSARTALSQGAMILSVIDPELRIENMTNAEIMKFVAKRRAVVSNATVNRQLQFLGRALRHMHRVHGAIVPDLDLKRAETAEPEERVRELSPDEQKRLFKHLRTDLHPLVQFALMTGARLSTICELRWRDIDHDNRRMTFRLKFAKTMRFPLSREIAALLSTLPKSKLPEDRRFVFTYEDQRSKDRHRRKITASGGGLMEDFRDALELAEIEDFRFHDLRHTFATRMLRETGNLKLVSRLIGHSKVETTARYAHVLDDDMANALEGFSSFRNGKSRTISRRNLK